MSILRTAVRNSIKYTYRLYTKGEIKRGWKIDNDKIFLGQKSGKPYFSCKALCEDEALVLTTLLMREIGNAPISFYYSEDSKRLFMRCYSSYNVNKSDRSIRLCYEKIIYEFIGRSCLKNISSDLDGQPLFWNGEVNNSTFISPLSDNSLNKGSPLSKGSLNRGPFLNSSYSPISNVDIAKIPFINNVVDDVAF